MAEPIYESEIVQLIVDNLVLTGLDSTLTADNAVSKSYVDTLVEASKNSILDGVGPAYDTLKELSVALSTNNTTLSTEIINKIAEEKKSREDADILLTNDLMDEGTNRLNADTALGTRIDDEKSDRTLAFESAKTASDLYTNDAVEVEKSRALGVEEGHGSRITTSEGDITSLQDDKFNKSGGNISGDVKLVDSFLNFGDNWRVRASYDGSKILFQHKKADNVWRTALPFICSI